MVSVVGVLLPEVVRAEVVLWAIPTCPFLTPAVARIRARLPRAGPRGIAGLPTAAE